MEIVDSLVQEVRDLIGVKSFGLYELIWALNTDHPELSLEDKIDFSMQAVRELVTVDALHLVKLRWPSEEVVDEMTLDELNRSHFDDPPEDGPYVALMEV